jgi:hypothetical protein
MGLTGTIFPHHADKKPESVINEKSQFFTIFFSTPEKDIYTNECYAGHGISHY